MGIGAGVSVSLPASLPESRRLYHSHGPRLLRPRGDCLTQKYPCDNSRMEHTIGRPFEHGNPGRPKGSVGGRARALMLLDSILAEEENQKLLGDAIRASFQKNPMLFFRQIIMPLMPRDLTLRFNDGGVVKWASLLDSFPRPPTFAEPSKQLPPSEIPPPTDQPT